MYERKPELKCPKCGSTNIKELTTEEQLYNEVVYVCKDCEEIFCT
ncbi:MAG: hypothetical protein ACFFBS_08030 [Promethearchaeota archaeon]